MSEENVRRLRQVYEAWAEGDFRRGRELFADDAFFAPGSPGDKPVRGKDAIAAHMRAFLSSWSDFHIVAQDFVDIGETSAGDVVLVTERQHATGKGSGVSLDQTFFAVWAFREGLVTSARWYTDKAEAQEAAGLSE